MKRGDQLTPELRRVLEEVVAKTCPDLLSSLDSDPELLPIEDRKRIMEALAGEIGVDESGEIDSRGRLADELISYMWSGPLAAESDNDSPTS